MNNIDREKLTYILSQLKSKRTIFILNMLCVFCFGISFIMNLIGGKTVPYILNLMCVICWLFVGFGNYSMMKNLNKEKEEILFKEELERKKEEDLKSFEFFG